MFKSASSGAFALLKPGAHESYPLSRQTRVSVNTADSSRVLRFS